MYRKKIENKINQIDEILLNDKNIEEYIDNINKKNIEIPKDLNMKIRNKICLQEESNKIVKFKNVKYPNILKIVACTIFSIILWETVLSKDVSYATSDLKKDVEVQSFYNKIDEGVKKVSKFFLGPINFNNKGGNL